MLNAKALTELLSQNRDDRLCKRWYLMTPNGTLLAYSQPTDINDLRKHAAIAAISWQEHQHEHEHEHVPPQDEDEFQGEFREDKVLTPLHVLVIQDETSNIIIRQIQRQLLLVLEGGVPPRRAGFAKAITAEGRDGSLLRPHRDDDSRPTTSSSEANGGNNVAASVLKLQRRKMDALATAIVADFDQTGFRMPERGGSTVF